MPELIDLLGDDASRADAVRLAETDGLTSDRREFSWHGDQFVALYDEFLIVFKLQVPLQTRDREKLLAAQPALEFGWVQSLWYRGGGYGNIGRRQRVPRTDYVGRRDNRLGRNPQDQFVLQVHNLFVCQH